MSSFCMNQKGGSENVCFIKPEKDWCTRKYISTDWSLDIMVKDRIYTHYKTTKLAGSTSLKNINICIHENRIRGGSELKQKVGDFVT